MAVATVARRLINAYYYLFDVDLFDYVTHGATSRGMVTGVTLPLSGSLSLQTFARN